MTTGLQLGFDALERAAQRTARQRLIARLVPLAQELAQRAGRDGVTVADLRIVATQRSVPLPESNGRTLSWLGCVMKQAGLRATDRFRRSPIPQSHANAHRVYVADEPSHAERTG